MNALTFGFKTPVPPGRRIVDAARAFAGHPFISAPERADCFDCVTLVSALTGQDISADWVRHGGRLPFVAIARRPRRSAGPLGPGSLADGHSERRPWRRRRQSPAVHRPALPRRR